MHAKYRANLKESIHTQVSAGRHDDLVSVQITQNVANLGVVSIT
jgi:hypothetical protein